MLNIKILSLTLRFFFFLLIFKEIRTFLLIPSPNVLRALGTGLLYLMQKLALPPNEWHFVFSYE